MNLRKLLCRLAVAGAIVGVTAAATALPHDTLTLLGERAAQLAVGLREPRGSVELLSGTFTRPTAAATVPTITVGEGFTQAVTTTATAVTTTAPSKAEGGGVVLTQQLSAGSDFVQGVAIRNKSGKTVSIAEALKRKPSLDLKRGSTAPQVLIVHTHTTECYMAYDNGTYTAADPTRTTDPAKNMIAVGTRVAEKLKAAGIAVLHDTAIHDQPYSTAYSHSKAAVEQYLKKYPSIRVVLDLHRDAIYQNETTHIKPTVTVNGKKAAQMMIIVGMKNTTAVPNKHTADNLSFGAHLQQALHQTYAGLVRPMLLADARYNQHLTNGALLIEMGSDANTLEEACYSGELLGTVLADVLEGWGS